MRPITRTAAGEQTTEAVMAFIEKHASAHGGQVPTVQEVGRGVGLAQSVANYHMSFLLADGRLRRTRAGTARGYEIAGAAYLLPAEAREVAAALESRREALTRAEARLAELEARLAGQATRLAAAEALLNGELSDLRAANVSLEESVLEMLEMLSNVVAVVERYGYAPGGTATVGEWLEAALGGMAAARRAPAGRRSLLN